MSGRKRHNALMAEVFNTPRPSGERYRKLKLYCAVCEKLRYVSGDMTKEHVAEFQERYICSDHPQEFTRMDYQETPPSLKMRQCEYQGRLWFLTRWQDLMRGGEWYTALTLEDGGEKLRVEMHPLEFQLMLPTLPWISLTPADTESPGLHAARNTMRQARG